MQEATGENRWVRTAVLSVLLAFISPFAARAVDGPTFAFPADLVRMNANASIRAATFPGLRATYRYFRGGDLLEHVRHECADTQSPWRSSKVKYGVRYRICDVATREGGDQLYVAGFDTENGHAIIERWDFAARRGGWKHRMTGPPPALGQPAGAYVGTTTLVDPPFKTFEASPRPAPTIALVHDSASIGIIKKLTADPQGRFLLALTYGETPTLYQIPITTTGLGTPVAIVTTQQFANLGRIEMCRIRHHAEWGRCIVLFEQPRSVADAATSQYLIAKDAANDGTFETLVTGSKEDFDATVDTDPDWQEPNWSKG